MFVSYVVRLRTAQLRRGSIAGEVVGVASGRRYGISSVEQMAAFLQRSCAEEEALTRRPTLPEDEPIALEGAVTEEGPTCPPW